MRSIYLEGIRMNLHHQLRLFYALLTFCLLFFIQTENGHAATFIDVPDSHPSVLEIEYLADTGIIKGYQDQTFKPSNYVTNSQVALMVTRALQLELENRPHPGFKDLSNMDSETFKAIAAVVDEGIFPKGDQFRPYEPITRGEMAQVLVNAFHLTGSTNKEFKDVPKKHKHYEAIQILAANNITTGYEDNTFKPSNPLTRSHFSTFMSRAIERDFIPVSSGYSYNKDYDYVYELTENNKTTREYFNYVKTDRKGNWWFVFDEFGTGIHYVDTVDKNGFTFSGFTEDGVTIIDFHIPYPVKLGTSWSYSMMNDLSPVTYIVTSMSETIKTPAGSFDNVIVIASSDGFEYYYSPDFGHILTKDVQHNQVVYELVTLKRR